MRGFLLPILTALFCPLLSFADDYSPISINDETEWPIVLDDEEPDYVVIYTETDINQSGDGSTLIDTSGRYVSLLGFEYDPDNYSGTPKHSFSIQNGSIKGQELIINSFTEYRFSNTSYLTAGSKGIFEIQLTNEYSEYPNHDAGLDISGYYDDEVDFSMSNNGNGVQGALNAGIWVNSTAISPVSPDSPTSLFAGVDMRNMASISIENNKWNQAAIYSYASNMTNEEDILDYNFISSRINIIGSVTNINNNSSEGAIIFSHVKIDSSLTTYQYFRGESVITLGDNGGINRIEITNNTGKTGIISSLVEVDPVFSEENNSAYYSASINLHLAHGLFKNNSTISNGGVISSVKKAHDGYQGDINSSFISEGVLIKANLNGDNVVFEGNHADGKGGAIYISGGCLAIETASYSDGEQPLVGDVIFRGNTMTDTNSNYLMANAVYVEANNAYDACIRRLNAETGTRIVFDGNVISNPYNEDEILIINKGGSLETRYSAPSGQYSGTVLFTGESAAQTIGGRQQGESEEAYAARLDRSLTSTINQQVEVYGGTLAVQKNAKLVIKSLTLSEEALVTDDDYPGEWEGDWEYDEDWNAIKEPVWTGNWKGIHLNTNFHGKIIVEGDVSFAGLADIDIREYLPGAEDRKQTINMEIGGVLSGRFELGNYGNLYEMGLEDDMFFILLTLDISENDTDVDGLELSHERFLEGLYGEIDIDEDLDMALLDGSESGWKLEWIYGIDGENTKSVVLYNLALPEPSGAMLGLLGLAGMLLRRRK